MIKHSYLSEGLDLCYFDISLVLSAAQPSVGQVLVSAS